MNELADAWAFVMAHVDSVGPDPNIEIKPIWVYRVAEMDDNDDPPRHFSVVVSGMVPDPEP
ncbi:hypothetical protein [Aeromicrobium panaciterrae]|uniref:hypothetical protein n=1 Tax=Aeromicrobium panaciterrae TaxID=363861 RepID=UPI0031DC77DC